MECLSIKSSLDSPLACNGRLFGTQVIRRFSFLSAHYWRAAVAWTTRALKLLWDTVGSSYANGIYAFRLSVPLDCKTINQGGSSSRPSGKIGRMGGQHGVCLPPQLIAFLPATLHSRALFLASD